MTNHKENYTEAEEAAMKVLLKLWAHGEITWNQMQKLVG